MNSFISLPPNIFYGSRSKKRTLHLCKHLENKSKQLKEEKIPNVYPGTILGHSMCWKPFFRQQEALDFAQNMNEEVHVFAFECRQPGKQSGQRQFLVATFPVFWHYYEQLDESLRHHYEVIPEGTPCKLYFDLEFYHAFNTSSDGVLMTEILIKYVSCWLKELFDVQCSRHDVLELTASNETKFSRHLIFQPEDAVFRDNITAGHFIQAIFTQLENYLFLGGNNLEQRKYFEHTAEKENSDESILGDSSPSFVSGSEQMTVLMKSSSQIAVEDRTENDECGDDSMTSSDRRRSFKSGARLSSRPMLYPNIPFKDIKEFVSDENTNLECVESVSDNTAECLAQHDDQKISVSQDKCDETKMNYSRKASGVLNTEIDCNQTFASLKFSLEEDTKPCASSEIKSTVSKTKSEESFSDKETLLQTSMGERSEEALLMELRHRVFQKFEKNELRSLFVKDNEGRDTCFADLGVYTKNRNFRLYKSCKLGKTRAFTEATQNSYKPASITNEKERDKEIFFASLITDVSNRGKHLVFEPETSRSHDRHKNRHRTLEKMPRSEEHIKGCGKSPYPDVDDFINSRVSGYGGTIRCWSYFPDTEVLSFDIIGYRFCYNVQRQHCSNNIKLVADLRKGVWYQKCYDPDCQAVNFRSQEFHLPSRILPSNYLEDDFEDLCENTTDQDDKACLLAMQRLEQEMSAVGETPQDVADSAS